MRIRATSGFRNHPILQGETLYNTETITRRFDRLRYIRQETNNGLDRDFDRAVELAHGEYCWLLSDDDVLKDGAIDSALSALRKDLSLIIVNAEHRDFHMSRVLHRRLLDIESDQTYGPTELDLLFEDTRNAMWVISCIIIKRAIWLARERKPYYASMLIHVGVIFQDRLPTEALVMAEPLVSHRRGNTHAPTFGPAFEIIMVKWPALVASLAISESLKATVCNAAHLRSFRTLLTLRAAGWYSLTDYQRWIRPRLHSIREKFAPVLVGLLPGVLINTLFVVCYSVASRDRHGSLLQTLRESRYHVRNVLKRM